MGRLQACVRVARLRQRLLVFAQGGDLYSYILTLQPFPEPLAKHFFTQLIEGISAMHERMSFHGDLKMENLMIAKNQESGRYSLQVGDFGLMRVRHGAAGTTESDEGQVHVLRAQSSGVVSRPAPSPLRAAH